MFSSSAVILLLLCSSPYQAGGAAASVSPSGQIIRRASPDATAAVQPSPTSAALYASAHRAASAANDANASAAASRAELSEKRHDLIIRRSLSGASGQVQIFTAKEAAAASKSMEAKLISSMSLSSSWFSSNFIFLLILALGCIVACILLSSSFVVLLASHCNSSQASCSSSNAEHSDLVHHWNGYTLQKRLYSGNEFKVMYKGICDSTRRPCILSFPAKGDKSPNARVALAAEAGILKHLSESKHIIRCFDYTAWGGVLTEPCLVTELVEPLGYDLTEVYADHFKSCLPLPVAQVHHYMRQLAAAVRYITESGVVHRNLKAEIVLVDVNHTVKITDFSLAVMLNDEHRAKVPHHRQVKSLAPELCGKNAVAGDESADIWGLGAILYFLSVGCSLDQNAVLSWAKPVGLARHPYIFMDQLALQHRLQDLGIPANFAQTVAGLLGPSPEKRWKLDQLEAWAGSAMEGTDDTSSTVECERWRGHPGSAPPVLECWPYMEGVPELHAFKVPADWGAAPKTAQSTLEKLKLAGAADGSMFAAMVVRNSGRWIKYYPSDGAGQPMYRDVATCKKAARLPEDPSPMTVISAPEASLELKAGDWIYLGVQPQSRKIMKGRKSLQEIEKHLMEQTGLTCAQSGERSPSEKRAVLRGRPQLDVFQFPEHCANSVLGPKSYASPGRNALDLRSRFQINIIGLVRSDDSVIWWPGPSALVTKGDRALLMRVPRWHEDTDFVLGPVVPPDHMSNLLIIDRFRQQLDLADSEWQAWRRNAGLPAI